MLERVLTRPNLQAALKRVRQNKGSSGIDGMSVEELPQYVASPVDNVVRDCITTYNHDAGLDLQYGADEFGTNANA